MMEHATEQREAEQERVWLGDLMDLIFNYNTKARRTKAVGQFIAYEAM